MLTFGLVHPAQTSEAGHVYPSPFLDQEAYNCDHSNEKLFRPRIERDAYASNLNNPILCSNVWVPSLYIMKDR